MWHSSMQTLYSNSHIDKLLCNYSIWFNQAHINIFPLTLPPPLPKHHFYKFILLNNVVFWEGLFFYSPYFVYLYHFHSFILSQILFNPSPPLNPHFYGQFGGFLIKNGHWKVHFEMIDCYWYPEIWTTSYHCTKGGPFSPPCSTKPDYTQQY